MRTIVTVITFFALLSLTTGTALAAPKEVRTEISPLFTNSIRGGGKSTEQVTLNVVTKVSSLSAVTVTITDSNGGALSQEMRPNGAITSASAGLTSMRSYPPSGATSVTWVLLAKTGRYTITACQDDTCISKVQTITNLVADTSNYWDTDYNSLQPKYIVRLHLHWWGGTRGGVITEIPTVKLGVYTVPAEFISVEAGYRQGSQMITVSLPADVAMTNVIAPSARKGWLTINMTAAEGAVMTPTTAEIDD